MAVPQKGRRKPPQKSARKPVQKSTRKKTARKGPSRGVVAFFAVVAALLALLVILIRTLLSGSSAPDTGEASYMETPPPEATISAATAEALESTPAVTPSPTPGPGEYIVEAVVSQPSQFSLESIAVENGARVDTYARTPEIHMGLSNSYASIEGVTTFRGNNYRDSAAYGNIPNDPKLLETVWSVAIGQIDDWGGVGWTGQCAIVHWPEETVRIMNIREEKQGGDLTEVIYATLDGRIYFLDLEDGQATRAPINVGAPIKGSVTVDPRGYPLLYVGQGIPEVNGRSVDIGTRIFSLIDQEMLFFLDGDDSFAQRSWYAFDAAPLIDGETDTMLQVGENAILYLVHLNTDYDPAAGTISIAPEVDRYVFRSSISDQPGMENSLAVYNQYGYFVDNSGLLQCVNLNTLTCEWAGDAGDDTDATIVLEQEADGAVALYTATEREHSASTNEYAYLRKINALTGELIWRLPVHVYTSADNEGGSFATPALGKGDLGDLIYAHMTRTPNDGATLLAISKESGEVVWQAAMGSGGWSSPVCVYAENGKGYVLVGSSSGALRLYDGRTGNIISILDLEGNIEGSPAVFNDMLVVGTRSKRIFGVRIKGGEA
ncbi:MAG TPA: PQQ-binding-like beta-propeller repeat protein [Candidatus Pullichristensenella stercorigallinarum]|uniref:PQQ-binding-like beta-propeller repeat protein n=1 Tax=Candidatus Pullichristensenella stercorigallinarum TaxID=2840909 RepID=A0A9D0ZJH5_9FIRM|nr:PQQ-binding-like beta-propeller repeat protein [Candidatus Pullichristensenella stercorigallinarum]